MSKKPESPSAKAGDSSTPDETTQPCPLGELVVTVKNLDGALIEGATVKAGAAGTRTTNASGIADFGKVKPGSYDVTAEKPGHSDKRNDGPRADGKPGVTVPEGGKETVDLVQHPSCANVAFFEGSTTKSKYYGFDHKTNHVATPGTGEYWLPTPAKGSLTMPADRQLCDGAARDGARWISIAIGKEIEVEVNFAFKPTDCIPCLANTVFTVDPADVAEAVTTSVSSKKATFKLKGKKKGEASLKVTCAGKDIGWLHIWCEGEATIKIDVVNIVSARAPEDAFSLASLKSAFQEIYRQAAIKVDMIDLGKVDLTAVAAFTTVETTGYPATGRFLDKSGTPSPYSKKAAVLAAMDTEASTILDARTTGTLPRAGAYRIYRYVPTAGCSIGGTVANIGSSPAFSFITDGASGRNSTAHEFGHCLGLKHPSDGTSTAQFAAHMRATLSTAVPAWAATNTEPASAVGAAHGNVMANDPLNLMGYWSDKANRKPLRYRQWKTVSRS